MLHFFSKKQILKDLIPDGHLDFHSHLLPGIDDGAKNAGTTVSLVRAMQDLRIAQLITTPHVMKNVWDNTEQSILATLEQTRQTLQSQNIAIPVSAAAEYLMDGSFVEHFRHNRLLTIKDNYVLVEMSYLNPPIQLYEILFELQVAGYKPILAHPERYLFYHANFPEYAKLKNAGCAFQLNLLSVVGYYGSAVARTAVKLLEKGLIDFAGSDVHHAQHIAAFSDRVVTREVQPISEALAHNQLFRP